MIINANRKNLSIIIPCFNGAHYLENCVKSIIDDKLTKQTFEVLIINDGSTDDTKKVCNDIELRYPGIVRSIHQVNKGHGGAINTGLNEAQGVYVKIVDCDDWLDTNVFSELLIQIELIKQPVDMILTNFMYDKVGIEHKRIMDYKKLIPINKICNWVDVRKFPAHKYILMHSIIYRTELLREIDLKLPEHCFYVDNLFAFEPIPHVKSIYYMDKCLYHYHIGRDEQSVNLKNMLNRIDQQLFVNKRMIDYFHQVVITNSSFLKESQDYSFHYLKTITMVSTILLILKNDTDAQFKKKELWSYLNQVDFKIYKKMRSSLMGHLFHLPGRLKIWIPQYLYRVAQKRIGFN